MNAVNAMLRDQQEARLEAAVAAANKWVDFVRPLVKAIGDLDEAASNLRYRAFPDHARTGREAASYVNDAVVALGEMLDGIRDDFIADERRTCAKTDDEIEEFDAFNDALEDETTSVRDAVKRIEADLYDAYIRGEAA